MDRVSTLFGQFEDLVDFFLPPLFYDSIRPSRLKRTPVSTNVKRLQASAKTARIIPIQVDVDHPSNNNVSPAKGKTDDRQFSKSTKKINSSVIDLTRPLAEDIIDPAKTSRYGNSLDSVAVDTTDCYFLDEPTACGEKKQKFRSDTSSPSYPVYDRIRKRLSAEDRDVDPVGTYTTDCYCLDETTERKLGTATPTPSYPVYDQIRKRLSAEDRDIDYINGDGNCFFRAISKQLYGAETFHKTIRSLIVDIIATNKSSFSQFIDDEAVQHHIERMSGENVWATTCEIYAAATLLQRDIYMLTPDPANTQQYSWLLFKPVFKQDSPVSTRNAKTTKTVLRNKGSNNQDVMDVDRPIVIDEDLESYCDACFVTLCNTNGNHYDRVVASNGKCNCFQLCPILEGQSCNVDLT